MKSALTRYRVMAWTTGVLLLALTLHVILQIVQVNSEDLPYSQAPGLGKWIPGADHWVPFAHGWLYLVYVVVAVDLWFRSRRSSTPLNTPRMVLVVLAGTVPAMSFVAERWVTGQLSHLRTPVSSAA